ncbi:hypothetical protein HN51_031892 [Arachis hypogaea]|uniref:BHLH domain-containing protein n=1 Tax=Arachis hypogaea TaxID=3818 RepID=A0A445B6T8_ARAHY|nr:transcription factor bHLH95 [Arachis hypogaea]QHO16161.1 Transcription factor [Arachis hypogaea]RYR34346.1 hypothetical protein Ahy_A10g049161 [Arachis hypogaea]
MAMSVENQDPNDIGFFWDNQPWDVSNFDNLGQRETKENLHIEMPPLPPAPINHLTQGEIEKKNEEFTTPVTNNKKRRRADEDGKRPMKNDGNDHDLHIWTERERRKKMRDMFANLHAMLPQLPPKADKSSIVDEAVRHIKTLQQTVENLEKKKRQRIQSLSVSVSPIVCESAVTDPQWNPYDSSSLSRDNNALTITATQHASNPSFVSAAVANNSPFFKTWASQNVVLNMCGEEAQFSICAEKKPSLFTTIAFVLQKHKVDVISASILCNHNVNRYMVLTHASRALLQFADANTVEETFKRAAEEIMMWLG